MAKGDHLFICLGTYCHHGIDLGNGFVIHYGNGLSNKSNARVEIVAMDKFSRGNPVQIDSTPSHYAPEHIIARAQSRLGEQFYDLYENNCEHFVNSCRHGCATSRQIGLIENVSRRAIACGLKLAVANGAGRKLINRQFGHLVQGRMLVSSVVADATQLATELALNKARLPATTVQKAGRRTGAATAAGLGWIVGGAPGAAGSAAFWMAGEWIGSLNIQSARQISRRIFNRAS